MSRFSRVLLAVVAGFFFGIIIGALVGIIFGGTFSLGESHTYFPYRILIFGFDARPMIRLTAILIGLTTGALIVGLTWRFEPIFLRNRGRNSSIIRGSLIGSLLGALIVNPGFDLWSFSSIVGVLIGGLFGLVMGLLMGLGDPISPADSDTEKTAQWDAFYKRQKEK